MKKTSFLFVLAFLWSSTIQAQVSPSFSQSTWEKDNRGRNWCCYNDFNGITLCTTCVEVDDYGKYYRIWMVLINNTGHSIIFTPSDDVNASVLNGKGKEKKLSVQSARDYSKRIKRTHNGELFMQGLGSAIDTYNASHKTITTSINETYAGGSAYAGAAVGTYGSSVYGGASAYGGSSNTTIKSTLYDPAAEARARAIAEINYTNTQISQASENQAKIQFYIKNKPLKSGETMSGYFNIQKKGGQSLIYSIVIDGVSYLFKWNISEDENTIVTN